MSIEKRALDWATEHDIELSKKDLERLHELASSPHARLLVGTHDCEVQVTHQPITDRLVLHAAHKRCFQFQDFCAL